MLAIDVEQSDRPDPRDSRGAHLVDDVGSEMRDNVHGGRQSITFLRDVSNSPISKLGQRDHDLVNTSTPRCFDHVGELARNRKAERVDAVDATVIIEARKAHAVIVACNVIVESQSNRPGAEDGDGDRSGQPW